MVDIAEAEHLIRQGLGRRVGRGDSNKSNNINTDTDMLSNGIHGYEQLTQNAFSQRLKRWLTKTIIPLMLIAIMPNLVILIWYTVAHCDGSYLAMLYTLLSKPNLGGMVDIWSKVRLPSQPVVLTILGYYLYALVMMKIIPGKTVYGPMTPKGNTPVYKDNGFSYYIITLALFWILTVSLHPFGISPSIIYDRFDEVLFFINVFSLIFCGFLYIKGRVSPSSSDSGSSGNIIFDYYWGMELYPRVFGYDIKVFTNCRVGMMLWALLVCVHSVKSYELYGFVDSMFVSVALQLLYITKFFWWEAGYLRTIDIMLDRAGFYICWGCLVYVPSLYASPTFYLVSHPIHLGPFVAFVFLFFGALSIYINYAADAQKQEVRSSNGQCLVWGKEPELIRAQYRLENGELMESLLLASGWWGLSRHFHYIPEIMLAFFWSIPALFDNIMPYSYLIFLTILLAHRSFRDDEKCSLKYGNYWKQYCAKVPYKIVPYVF